MHTNDTTAWLLAVREQYPPEMHHLTYEVAMRIETGEVITTPGLVAVTKLSEKTIRRYLDRLRQDRYLDWDVNRTRIDGTRQRANEYALRTPEWGFHGWSARVVRDGLRNHAPWLWALFSGPSTGGQGVGR